MTQVRVRLEMEGKMETRTIICNVWDITHLWVLRD